MSVLYEVCIGEASQSDCNLTLRHIYIQPNYIHQSICYFIAYRHYIQQIMGSKELPLNTTLVSRSLDNVKESQEHYFQSLHDFEICT